jgi:hypothetical protein
MNEDYRRLDVAIDSTDLEIDKAYRKRAKEVHPDKNGGEKEEFQRLKESYDRVVKSRKQGSGLMSDSLLPMDFMGMAFNNQMNRLNQLNRLNRLNQLNMKNIEEDIVKNCDNFYNDTPKIIDITGQKMD